MPRGRAAPRCLVGDGLIRGQRRFPVPSQLSEFPSPSPRLPACLECVQLLHPTRAVLRKASSHLSWTHRPAFSFPNSPASPLCMSSPPHILCGTTGVDIAAQTWPRCFPTLHQSHGIHSSLPFKALHERSEPPLPSCLSRLLSIVRPQWPGEPRA